MVFNKSTDAALLVCLCKLMGTGLIIPAGQLVK